MVEKEATPEKPKQMGNREKMRRKEENWEVVIITSITINTSVTIISINYNNDHHSHSHVFTLSIFFIITI